MDKHSTISLLDGHSMPVIGVGTWQLQDAAATITTALELGYTMIDTSGNYGTQPGIAQGLKTAGKSPDDYFITTKTENDQVPIDSLKRSLDELGLESVDLTLIHWPPHQGAGEELWRGLIAARDQGLTNSIGVSNYSAEQIETIAQATDEWPAVNQVEWTPFGHTMVLLDFAKQHQIIIQAWSPLTRAKQLDHHTLDSIAAAYRKSPAQIVLRWDVQLGVVPLPKAHSQEHLQQNLDIFDFHLEDKDMAAISHLNSAYSTQGRLHY